MNSERLLSLARQRILKAEGSCSKVAHSSSPCPRDLEGESQSNSTIHTHSSKESDEGEAMGSWQEEQIRKCGDLPKCVKIQKAVADAAVALSNTDRHQVSFHQVQIRRYPIILGDSPACQHGLPICLGWDYEELPPLDLDDFEATRQVQRRTKLRYIVLSYFQRQKLLERFYSIEELKEAKKEIKACRRQRQITQLFLPLSKLEEVFESARRKLQRKFRSYQESGQNVVSSEV